MARRNTARRLSLPSIPTLSELQLSYQSSDALSEEPTLILTGPMPSLASVSTRRFLNLIGAEHLCRLRQCSGAYSSMTYTGPSLAKPSLSLVYSIKKVILTSENPSVEYLDYDPAQTEIVGLEHLSGLQVLTLLGFGPTKVDKFVVPDLPSLYEYPSGLK